MAFEGRLARLRSALGDYDGLIASDPAHVQYLTGLSSMGYSLYGITPLFAVIGREGPPEIVAAAADAAWVMEQVDLSHVHVHGRFFYYGKSSEVSEAVGKGLSLYEAVIEALEAVRARRRVGIDDRLWPSRFLGLAEALKPRDLHVATEVFLSARRVKDNEELATLRAVNLITERALFKAIERIHPGVTERQISIWIQQEMVAQGAQPGLMVVGIAERGSLVDRWASDRAVNVGESIRFDLGCVYKGYHSDLSRTAVLGAPPKWLLNDYGAIVAGLEAAIGMTSPGVTGEELFDVAVAATRAAGIPHYQRTNVGHGIGLHIYEDPPLAPGSRTPLEPGMTLCLETPYYMLGKAGVQIEDAVVVTETGCERLGKASQDLIRIEV